MVAIIDDIVLGFLATQVGMTILAVIVGILVLFLSSFIFQTIALTFTRAALVLAGIGLIVYVMVPQLQKKNKQWIVTLGLAAVFLFLGVSEFLVSAVTGMKFSIVG